MKLSIKAGATSQSVNIFVRDSSSTTGGGLASIAPAGGSLLTGTKLDYSFTGTNAARVNQALSVLAAVNSAFSAGGIVQIDNTNMIGWVRVDIPDAAITTGKGRVVSFLLWGGTNMASTPFEIELTGWDNQDAVHGGFTCLPNTAVTTNASLLTSGSGTDQLLVASGKVVTPDTQKVDVNTIKTQTVTCAAGVTVNVNVGTTQPENFTGTGASALLKVDVIDWNSVAVTGMPMPTYTQPTGFLAATFPSGTIANTTNITAGTITTVTTVTNQLTAAAIATGVWTDTTAGDFTTSLSIGKSIMNGVTLGTGLTINAYTGDTPQTGDSFARIGATGSGLTSLAPSATALSTAQWTNTLATNLGTTNSTVATNLNATVSSRSAPGTAQTIDGTSPLTEAYATGAFTLAQALYEIAQVVGQFSIASTTLSFQKRDGVTTGGTFTLSDATNPVSRTRAS